MFNPLLISLVIAQLDVTTLIPVGTVTGMLVVVFGLFVKDAVRSDKRADKLNAQRVAEVEADRDRAAAQIEKLQAEVTEARNQLHALQINQQAELNRVRYEGEARCREKMDPLYERIKTLEALIYKKRYPEGE